MTSLRLRIHSKGATLPILLKGEQWLVGRDPHCEIMLDDPTVSRRHALLYRKEGALWIRDSGARNETIVNGKALDGEQRLEPGDRLLIGTTTVEVAATDYLRARIVREPTKTRSADTVMRGTTRVRQSAAETRSDQLTSLLAPVVTPEDAAQLALDLLADSFAVRRGVVARLGPSRSIQVLASRRDPHSNGGASEEVTISDRTISQLKGTREAFLVPGASNGDSACDALLAPIWIRGEIDGLVYLERLPASGGSDGDHLELLSRMARLLASRLCSLYEIERLQQENSTLRASEWPGPKMHAVSTAWRDVLALAEPLRDKHNPVTLLGEPGTGKCLVARYLHLGNGAAGPSAPLVIADCRSAPGADVGNDLFGGSDKVLKRGWLAAAHGGTLVLRNIEELSTELQERLVAALAHGETQGPSGRERLTLRLIATSTLAKQELFDGRRLVRSLTTILANCTIQVPPLREHLEDLPGLVSQFLEEFEGRNGDGAGVSPRAMECLRTYGWPGNVAELRECLRTASTLAAGSPIRPKHLPKEVLEPRTGLAPKPSSFLTLEEVEKQHILRVLEAVGGNKVLAARILGIASSTLYEKLKRYE